MRLQSLRQGIDIFMAMEDETSIRNATPKATVGDGKEMSPTWVVRKIGQAKLAPDHERSLEKAIEKWEREFNKDVTGKWRLSGKAPYDRSFVTVVALWLIPFTTLALLVTLAIVTLVGIWAGSRVERAIGAKDPGIIVIDEVAGMLVSVLLVPRTIPVLLVAFFLFRLFDVWKPFPAHESQSLTGGLGVMVDDLIAGVYALVLVMGARALFGVPA